MCLNCKKLFYVLFFLGDKKEPFITKVIVEIGKTEKKYLISKTDTCEKYARISISMCAVSNYAYKYKISVDAQSVC